MALRNILKEGESTLKKRSRPVADFNERLWELLDDMAETLYEADGLGLAAPQVGVLRRVVLVLQPGADGEDTLIELVNPEIVEASGEQDGIEGCLSVPGVWGLVRRPMRVKLRAQDRHGKHFEIEGEGITARAFCHELAHLEGQLFTEVAHKILSEDEIEELMQERNEGAGEEKPE
ncbi:MAG TPA: peptide deformylase [Clostridiales bacterium]|nr:peptide deformylase [Clostridiales bacterium]